MDLTRLINHPELMDKETLYDLRSMTALYPYFQTARLLMLQNLYLLHDSSFDEELRRAAIYMTDRKAIFDLVESVHYKLKTAERTENAKAGEKEGESRTITLIDSFLGSLPVDPEETRDGKRKPTPADAAVDYVSYLLDIEGDEEGTDSHTPQMIGQNLIDNFINNENGKIQLKDEPEYAPQMENETEKDESESEEGYFTETLAKIYIKQGRYSKALEIIQRLNLNYPKKNAYFADQIRFLEKLILNNNKIK
ncbi:MAG: tetratricopeptide repeat protein [Prevotella sp.]